MSKSFNYSFEKDPYQLFGSAYFNSLNVTDGYYSETLHFLGLHLQSSAAEIVSYLFEVNDMVNIVGYTLKNDFSGTPILLLPTIGLGRVLPIGLKLSHILLRRDVIEFLGDIFTIFIVIDTLTAVTFNHILPQQTYSLVRDLTFPCPLFCRQQIFDRVLSSTSLLNSDDGDDT